MSVKSSLCVDELLLDSEKAGVFLNLPFSFLERSP